MMRIPILSLALVSLIACNPPVMTTEAQEDACGPGPPNQNQAERAVFDWCQQRLKDPDSAQTRNIRVHGRGAIHRGLLYGGGWAYGWIVSFEVNAKNGFGAYIGYREHGLIWNDGQCRYIITPDGSASDMPNPL